MSGTRFHCFVFQRLDIYAVTHDHGSDITKGVRLSGTHSFLCVDHELDLTVQAGIQSALFAPIFHKAAHIVSLLRNCKNLYRKLRDEQVLYLVFIFTCCHPDDSAFFVCLFLLLSSTCGRFVVFPWSCLPCL